MLGEGGRGGVHSARERREATPGARGGKEAGKVVPGVRGGKEGAWGGRRAGRVRRVGRAGVGASTALGNGVRLSPARGEGGRPKRPSPAYRDGKMFAAEMDGVAQG